MAFCFALSAVANPASSTLWVGLIARSGLDGLSTDTQRHTDRKEGFGGPLTPLRGVSPLAEAALSAQRQPRGAWVTPHLEIQPILQWLATCTWLMAWLADKVRARWAASSRREACAASDKRSLHGEELTEACTNQVSSHQLRQKDIGSVGLKDASSNDELPETGRSSWKQTLTWFFTVLECRRLPHNNLVLARLASSRL